MTAFHSALIKLVKLKEASSSFLGLKSDPDTTYETEYDSFSGDLEHDQDTEDYPKNSVQFTDSGEDDTYSCDSAEYCDEVSEPPDYNELT